MNGVHGITQGTPTRIPFGAGFYFHGVPYSEKVAPTLEACKQGCAGATQEGGTVTFTPEYFDIPLDGATVLVEELKKQIGEKSQMEVSFAEMSPDMMAHQMVAQIGETEDKKHTVLTSAGGLRKGHFYAGFGFYGEFIDGREMIIMYKKALCTSGASFENKPKTNTVFKGTFECHSDLEYGVTKLPYVIFIRNAEGWESTTPEDLKAVVDAAQANTQQEQQTE